jgi:hypothetical protein
MPANDEGTPLVSDKLIWLVEGQAWVTWRPVVCLSLEAEGKFFRVCDFSVAMMI